MAWSGAIHFYVNDNTGNPVLLGTSYDEQTITLAIRDARINIELQLYRFDKYFAGWMTYRKYEEDNHIIEIKSDVIKEDAWNTRLASFRGTLYTFTDGLLTNQNEDFLFIGDAETDVFAVYEEVTEDIYPSETYVLYYDGDALLKSFIKGFGDDEEVNPPLKAGLKFNDWLKAYRLKQDMQRLYITYTANYKPLTTAGKLGLLLGVYKQCFIKLAAKQGKVLPDNMADWKDILEEG